MHLKCQIVFPKLTFHITLRLEFRGRICVITTDEVSCCLHLDVNQCFTTWLTWNPWLGSLWGLLGDINVHMGKDNETWRDCLPDLNLSGILSCLSIKIFINALGNMAP